MMIMRMRGPWRNNPRFLMVARLVWGLSWGIQSQSSGEENKNYQILLWSVMYNILPSLELARTHFCADTSKCSDLVSHWQELRFGNTLARALNLTGSFGFRLKSKSVPGFGVKSKNRSPESMHIMFRLNPKLWKSHETYSYFFYF